MGPFTSSSRTWRTCRARSPEKGTSRSSARSPPVSADGKYSFTLMVRRASGPASGRAPPAAAPVASLVVHRAHRLAQEASPAGRAEGETQAEEKQDERGEEVGFAGRHGRWIVGARLFTGRRAG